MGKSKKLFKALVSGVKAFKSPSKEKSEKDRSSDKADKDHLRKGSKEKCLWSLGKSASRNRDSLSAAAAFLDAPEIKSVQVENLNLKDVMPTSGSCAPDTGYASKGLNSMQDKPLRQLKDSEQEELAAVKIQAAIRRYLAGKHVARALRGLVRLQALYRGRLVRKQAAAALRCMQALVRVQALARGRRVRSSELGQLIQKHIQQSRQQKKKPVEGWVSSTATLQQWQAKAQSKQDAVMKRQRALVYAFSEQLNRSSIKQTSSAPEYQPDKSQWGWAWLERWMAAQPVRVSHNMAKEQLHNKFETLKTKPDADAYLEACERDLSLVKEPVEDSEYTSITEIKDLDLVPYHTPNHASGENVAAEEKEIAFCAGGKSLEQVKDKEENLLFEVSTATMGKKFLPSTPPPPPPPPQWRRPSPSSFVQSPTSSIPLPPPQVCTKVVPRPLPTPPPPPPPPPRKKQPKPLVAPESTPSEYQQAPTAVATSPPSSKFSYPISLASASRLIWGETSSSKVPLPFSTTEDLPGSHGASSLPSSSLLNESLPVPITSESNHEPLLATPTASARNSEIMQDECEKETISTPKPYTPTETFSSLHSPMSPVVSVEVLASSSHQYAALRTPLVIPNVTDEEMSDSAEEATVMAIEDDLTSRGKPGVYKVHLEENVRADCKGGNGEIDMDLDEPDVANVLRIDEAMQDNHLTNEIGGDNLSGTLNDEKAMEVVPNKHAASPPSRQGQPTEAVSPSLPNYMTTTKSSKAKIRSPSHKLDSPKQKPDPRPRFDASKSKVSSPKQKLDSPKQRRDLSKQKADSPSQKADSAVKRRHSLSAVEGKGSPGTNKTDMHVRASSKGQLVSLRVDTSMEDSPRSNGHSRKLEK